MKRVRIIYNKLEDGKIESMMICIPKEHQEHRGTMWAYCSKYFKDNHGKYYHLSIDE